MTQEVVNVGANADDGTGDSLYEAGNKINNNFEDFFNLVATFLHQLFLLFFSKIGILELFGSISLVDVLGFVMHVFTFDRALSFIQSVGNTILGLGITLDSDTTKSSVEFGINTGNECNNNCSFHIYVFF